MKAYFLDLAPGVMPHCIFSSPQSQSTLAQHPFLWPAVKTKEESPFLPPGGGGKEEDLETLVARY